MLLLSPRFRRPDSTASDLLSAPFRSLLRPGSRGLANLVGSLGSPVVALVCLPVCCRLWGVPVTAPYVVAGLLAFVLLFPGRWSRTPRQVGIVPLVIGPWLLAAIVLLLLAFTLQVNHLLDPRVIATWMIATPVLQFGALLWIPRLVPVLIRLRRKKHRVAVIGATTTGIAFSRSLAADPMAHAQVVALFDDRSPERLGLSHPDNATALELLAGSTDDALRCVQSGEIDQVYIALPISHPRVMGLLEAFNDSTVSIYCVPDIMAIDLIQPRIDSHVGFPVLGLRESPFLDSDGFIKRIFDLVVASMAIIALAPLLLGVALAVRLTSPGPIIFMQRRCGLDGTEIVVYKFRSMTVTEDGVSTYRQVERGDSRLTSIGAFIRKTSLDELPQLFNVLQGRMSLVGPRPHALKVNEQYRALIRGYMIRHKVRPGITGWAQVHGFRGGDDLESMTHRIEYDLQYLRGNWSLWLDLSILARTARLVLDDSRAF